MFGSVALEVFIGLVGVFLIFSLVVSGIREGIAKMFQTRAKSMWTTLQRLLDDQGPPVDNPVNRVSAAARLGEARPRLSGGEEGEVELLSVRLARHPFIQDRDGTTVAMGRTKLHRIEAKDFAASLLDLLAVGSTGTTMAKIRAGIESLEELSPSLQQQLQTLIEQGADDVAKLGKAVEDWYDSRMKSLSDWYRRRTRWVGLLIGVFIAFLFNVNAIGAGAELWQNATLREAAVATASSQVDKGLTDASLCTDPAEYLACVEEETAKLVDAGYPFGWSCTDPEACETLTGSIGNAWDQAWDGSGDEVVLRVIGWLIAAAAMTMGASFWYDVLRRATGVRTKLKPAT